MVLRFQLLSVCCLWSLGVFCQDTAKEKPKITVGGYVDAYVGYHSVEPTDKAVPFFVSSARHNEFNINLAYVTVSYEAERIRGRLTPAIGTYMAANYAAEPPNFRHFQEASAGVRLWAKRNIWLDVGLIGSPFTNETCISKDHLLYSRSLAPEYVPYYLTGAKLTLPLSSKLNLYLYLLNGWQNIVETNDNKALATQLEYRPTAKTLFNWNTYIGNEQSIVTPENRMRYFTDLYTTYNTDGKLSVTACIYAGVQQRQTNQTQTDHLWGQANVAMRYRLSVVAAVAGRVEYYYDPDKVQIQTNSLLKGFNGGSFSLGYTHKITENALFRVENRTFFTQDDSLVLNNGFAKHANWSVANLTLWF